MKRAFGIVLAMALCVSLSTHATGQSTQPASSGKTLAATMNVYVFPSQGQSASTQSKDEADCYSWAVKNTGIDPFQLSKQTQQQQQQAQAQAQAAQGQGVRTAAKGAAAGALIGGIAGDAGTGAAVGAATGAIAGRRRKKQAEAQAQSQSQAAAQYSEEQTTNFKKAFSACLEGKKYMVKY
jgi:Glycine-zipper domain